MPVTRSKVGSIESHRQRGSKQPYDTPTKARLRQAVGDFYLSGPSPVTRCKSDIFARFNIPTRSANAILVNPRVRRATHGLPPPQRPGPPPKVTPKQLHECERLITEYGLYGRSMTWEQLAYEAEIEVTGRTLAKHMGLINYRRCIACRSP